MDVSGFQIRTQHAEDTIHTQRGRVLFCPNCQRNALAYKDRLMKLVWIEKQCSLCIAEMAQRATTAEDVQLFKAGLQLMIQQNEQRLEGRIEKLDDKMQFHLTSLNTQLEKLKTRLEEDMSPSNAIAVARQMDRRLAIWREDVCDEVRSQVEATNRRVSALERGQLETVEVLQSLRQNMKDCNQRMRKVEDDSFSAASPELAALQNEVDTLKHTVKTLLPHYEYVRNQLDEGEVQWGVDVESVRDGVDKIQMELVAFRRSTCEATERLHGLEEMQTATKRAADSYYGLEDRIMKRLAELFERQDELERGQARLEEGQANLEAKFEDHEERITGLSEQVASMLRESSSSVSTTSAAPPSSSHRTSNDSSNRPGSSAPSLNASRLGSARTRSVPETSFEGAPNRISYRLTRTLSGHSNWVLCCAELDYGNNQRVLVSGCDDGTLKLWDVESGICLGTFHGHSSRVGCVVVVDIDGNKFIVSGSKDGSLKVWNVRTGACDRTMGGHSSSPIRCCSVLGSKLVVSGNKDGFLMVWDIETGTCLQTMYAHSSDVNCCTVLEDSAGDGNTYLISGSKDGTLRTWNVETGACVRVLESQSLSNVYCCDVLDSDNKLVVSGSKDGLLQIWDVETGTCPQELEGHSSSVECCTILEDSRGRKLIVSGSGDGTVKIWDVETGTCLDTLEGHQDYVRCCAVLDGGTKLVSGSDDKTLKVWSLEM